MFEFIDRMGNREVLATHSEESVDALLQRNGIPAASVIVLRNGHPIADSHVVEPGASYEAALIEGYDIRAIRQSRERLRSQEGARGAAYEKRRLAFSKGGEFQVERAALTLDETAALVEQTVLETCREFDLVAPGAGVLVGLSGGVDSSSLLITLAELRKHLPSFRLVAVTFEDYDSVSAPTYRHATELARRLGVEHQIAPATLAEEVFRLKRRLRDILPALMHTPAAHHVMYIDHHTTRRTLEVVAQRNGLDRIALGLHTTDLVAGLLNGWASGYAIADIPSRKVGDITYIYPLAFVQKRELHLYHYQRTGTLARHAHPNPWERNPLDRNFYYYLADQLQSLWPSIETMLFTGHSVRLRSSQTALRYERCANCGSAVLCQPFTPIDSDMCDVCTLLDKAGYIERNQP